MSEEHFGPSFETTFISNKTPIDPRVHKLILWGKKLSLIGLTPTYPYGAAGNFSIRTSLGFIITATGKDIGKLKEEDFVEVRNCSIDNRELTAIGKYKPSSESMMHCAIFGEREEVKVIMHVHDEYAVKNCKELGLRCTEEEKPSGSVGLLNEVIKVLGDHDYIVIKNHGIISLGSTVEEAGERIMVVRERIKG
jgi:L-fuculose-phosphate aldolase